MEPGDADRSSLERKYALAESLCRRAGVALERPLPVELLVAACLGPRAIRIAEPGTIHAHTKLVRLGQCWRIYVQRGLPPRMQNQGVLRCLVEWELAQGDPIEHDREELLSGAVALLEAAVDHQARPRKADTRRSSRAAGHPRQAKARRAGTRRTG